MHFVRATTSGPWRTVDVIDIYGQKFGERYLIMAAEAGKWSIDNEGVDVQPGLVVSFRDAADADWFLSQRRAQPVAVEPEAVVAFHKEGDANFFVIKGLAEHMSEREVQAFFARMNGTAGPEPEPEPEPEPMTIAATPTAPALKRRGRKPAKE